MSRYGNNRWNRELEIERERNQRQNPNINRPDDRYGYMGENRNEKIWRIIFGVVGSGFILFILVTASNYLI